MFLAWRGILSTNIHSANAEGPHPTPNGRLVMAQRDADDQFEDGNPRFDDAAAGKPRKTRAPSAGTNWGKIILILGGVGAVSLALCCGGGYYMLKDAMTIDPVKVAARQKEIIEIDIPQGLQPAMGMNMNFGVMKMKMVMYNPGNATSLMLMEMQITGQTEEQMKQAFSQQANQQQQQAQFRVESSETKKIKIDGVERDFQFAKGTITPQGGKPVPARMISGLFPSKTAMGFISYTIKEEDYNEAAVIKTLESIHK